MKVLLPNRFDLPQDGWFHISALGEFKHNPTGLVQILDADSCRAMIETFQREAKTPNFPGILVDFDHFSLDQDKPTEAAGWIAALTNDPNISGMVPLSNKKQEKPAAAAEGDAPVPTLIQLGSRDRARFNRALVLANADTPVALMTDEQRRAMFARMRGGGGGGGWGGGGGGGGVWGGGGGGSSGTGAGGASAPAYRPPDYSSSRESAARIAVLEQQRVSTLKALWRDAANGDEQAVMRGLRKLGVDPAPVIQSVFVPWSTQGDPARRW